MATINIGILAHVDAGKTSLTERILFETGVINAIGSVDKGTTQTDTLALERARGITIKAAVAAFHLHDLRVHLIDTPGHSDFIAEVARSLRVLDAVILVVSAVEGVQPQTRRLARAIRAAGLPLLIFVNKLDRLGARGLPLLVDLREKLGLSVLALSTPVDPGTRSAAVVPVPWDEPRWREELTDLLAETSERVIAEFERVGGVPEAAFLARELREQVAGGTVVPVFYGSAITGSGVPELLDGVRAWLPPANGACTDPLSGEVFKITRRASGEKLVYLRLFTGSLGVRQRVTLQRRSSAGELEEHAERITGIERFNGGTSAPVDAIAAGDIAALHGLRSARIGDRIGDEDGARELLGAFPVPALESVVRPIDPGQVTHLRAALEQLAEQDPLMTLRHRNEAGEISVRLYGEVQKEVITDTLAQEYGLAVTFGPSRTICIERVTGTGAHLERIFTEGNPYYATLGFRIEPASPGSGIRYIRDLGALPLAFYRAIEETVYETLRQGLRGWEVADCVVTLTEVGMCPITTAADFRALTPLVLMHALDEAGTDVCEPIEELDLVIPDDTYGAVCGALVNARATLRDSLLEGSTQRLLAEVPTAELRALEQQLPGLTRGEGDWLATFAGHIPVTGDVPERPRHGANPLNRAHYLAEVARA
jgi:ribosomal protection tetracycline resistance protein